MKKPNSKRRTFGPNDWDKYLTTSEFALVQLWRIAMVEKRVPFDVRLDAIANLGGMVVTAYHKLADKRLRRVKP